jgi:hypothetical protein
MKFSLNGTTWSAWADYTTTKTIDITDVSLGGNSSAGTKIVYVKFGTIDGIESKVYSVNIGYYYSAITVDTTWKTTPDKDKRGKFTIQYTLPDDMKVVPPKYLRIYEDGVKQKEEAFRESFIWSNGCNLTVIDALARQIRIGTGEVINASGTRFSVSLTNITLDNTITSDRYDLIYIDILGEVQVLKGVEGLTENTLPFINWDTNVLYPRPPVLEETLCIPLFYIYIARQGTAVDNSTFISTPYIVDARPTLLNYFYDVEEKNTLIKFELVDMAGRCASVSKTINLSGSKRSTKQLKAYTNSGKTTPIINGQYTTLNSIYVILA